MNVLLLVACLHAGPPVLPDLPAERAAKARAAEAARQKEQPKPEPEPAPEEPASEEPPVSETSAPEEPPAQPSASRQAPVQPPVQRPGKPVTAEQLRDAAPEEKPPLEAASEGDVATWSEDDAQYAASGPPDGQAPPSSAPPRHAPTRTAARLRAGVPLEQKGRPPKPRTSAAFVFGVDAGAQWAVTRWMWVHAAVGWIRPTFQRPERAVYHDSFTFKLGIGF